MNALIWLRRMVLTLLAAMLLLVLFGVYVVVDRMVQVALVGQLGVFLPICLWLDRRFTTRLQSYLLAQTLRGVERLTGYAQPPTVRPSVDKHMQTVASHLSK